MAGFKKDSIRGFLVSAIVIHTVTYFIFGFIASSAFGYAGLFGMPVIRDYYKPFGSVSNYLGPVIQILRGLAFGLVLLPFKKTIAGSKYGWLHMWLLFVGIGILGTPSAAPSSIEGVVYTKLPMWFHLVGFPEILLQTLAFSMILHNSISEHKLVKAEKALVLIAAVSTACVSFIGYTVVSIAFALLSKANIEESGADPRILAQFVLPLVFIFVVALVNKTDARLTHLVLYVASVASLILYQRFVLGSGNWTYALIAPVIPVLISLYLSRKKRGGGRGG